MQFGLNQRYLLWTCLRFFSAEPNPFGAQKPKTVVETASMKLLKSKPYLYFKVKSPLRMPMGDTQPLNLSVSVRGLQPIKIKWKKDLHELFIGDRYKTFDNDRRLLVEPPYTQEDSGSYSASACNAKGCEARSAQVVFYGKITYQIPQHESQA